MFETQPNLVNTLNEITLGNIARNTGINPAEFPELMSFIRNSSTYTGTYTTPIATYDCRKDATETVLRDDVSVCLKILEEINTAKPVVRYTTMNLLKQCEPYTDESVEYLNNLSDNNKNLLTAYVFNNIISGLITGYNTGNKVVIGHITKGASFMLKIKDFDFETLLKDRYSDIKQVTKLEEKQIELTENKYDFNLLLKIELNNGWVSYVLLTTRYTWQKYRKLISYLPEFYMQDIIEGTSGNFITKINNIFEELGKQDTNDNTGWMHAVIDYLQDEEREQQRQKSVLKHFIDRTRDFKLRSLKTSIERQKANLETISNNYGRALDNLRELEVSLLAAKNDPTMENILDETLTYANKAKYISNIDFKDVSIEFTFDAPIKYFDAQYAEKVYEHMDTSSDLAHAYDGAVFKEIFKKIFIDQEYTLWTSCRAYILFYDEGITTHSQPLRLSISAASPNTLKFTGQPHLNEYQCLGNNETTIRKCLSEFDLLGALDLFTNCTQNFNLTDSAVLDRFKRNLVYRDAEKETLYDHEKDKFVSFKELYDEYLTIRKDEESENNEQEN